MTIRDLLIREARCGLNVQAENGAMPAGHNGPYNDMETPVRNTAHWLIIFCHAWTLTRDPDFRQAAERAVGYLLGPEARPMGASFFCRTNPEKDFCNGLVGQAWVIEGLIAFSRSFGGHDALKTALDLFFLHPFHEDRAVWRRVAVDGSYLAADETFNHQLWFAASASRLDDEEVQRRVLLFLSRVVLKVQTYRDGVIFHQSRLGVTGQDPLRKIHSLASRIANRRRLYAKSVGYHGFNLYALAILKQSFPHHPFWSSHKMVQLLRVLSRQDFQRNLEKSLLGYRYNPSGIEFAFVAEIFDLEENTARDWLNRQVNMTYNREDESLMTRGSPDPVTSAARLYECVQLSRDYELDVHG